MTKKEFAQFGMILKAFYPKETILPNDACMNAWYELLKDLDYNVACAGLRKWATTNKWSPTIADIREMAVSVTQGEIPTWDVAWGNVMVAIRKFGYCRCEEAMASLDELTQECVRNIGGFVNICMSENIEADRANFRMTYERKATRKREDAQVPLDLKNIIENLFRVERIEQNDN